MSLAFPIASKPFRWRRLGVAWRGSAWVSARSRHGGFTLIELMITITLVGILLSMAIPSFQSVIQRNRATAQTNTLLAAFNLARSEAIKRGEPVGVCSKKKNADECRDKKNWKQGWIVYVPSDSSVLRVWSAPTGMKRLRGPETVTYLGSGEISDPGLRDMVIEVKNCSGNHGRRISFSATGHATAASFDCSPEEEGEEEEEEGDEES